MNVLAQLGSNRVSLAHKISSLEEGHSRVAHIQPHYHKQTKKLPSTMLLLLKRREYDLRWSRMLVKSNSNHGLSDSRQMLCHINVSGRHDQLCVTARNEIALVMKRKRHNTLTVSMVTSWYLVAIKQHIFSVTPKRT